MKKLFYNGNFYSMEDAHSTYRAVLCEDGAITDTFHQVPKNCDCEKIDLRGSFVFPGFVDSHTHSFEGGLYQNGADLSKCETIADVLDCLRGTTPFSDMIFAWKFDENNIQERRFPTKTELDSVFPDIPVLLRRIDGHSCVVNSCFKTSDLKLQTAVHTAGGILRGALNDLVAHSFHRNLCEEAILKCYETAQGIAIKNGFTGIHTMIGDAKDDFLHFELMLNSLKDFIIDWTLYPQCFHIDKVVETFDKKAIKSRRIGGCILADGSFGSGTAAISEPYDTAPPVKAGGGRGGGLYQSQSFWNDFISKAQANDLSVAVHCIGDRAIEQIVQAILESRKSKIKSKINLRHQIIHCELVRDDMLAQMKQANVYAVMQPMFDALWGGTDGFYSSVIGKERVKYLNRFKTLTDCGIPVVGSSDWYITDLSAFKGINATINHHNKAESLSNYEAIKLYTTNHAKLSHNENTNGYIKKNYIADFVCTDKNLMTIKDTSHAKVLMTIKAGEIVYGK